MTTGTILVLGTIVLALAIAALKSEFIYLRDSSRI
jgi:hypothetical protein